MYITSMIIEREIFSKIKPLISSPEAIIITGMRRVGKTTLLKYTFDKIDNPNKLFTGVAIKKLKPFILEKK